MFNVKVKFPSFFQIEQIILQESIDNRYVLINFLTNTTYSEGDKCSLYYRKFAPLCKLPIFRGYLIIQYFLVLYSGGKPSKQLVALFTHSIFNFVFFFRKTNYCHTMLYDIRMMYLQQPSFYLFTTTNMIFLFRHSLKKV